MKDLEVPVLTVLIWAGALVSAIVGATSELLNWMAKSLLKLIARANKRLGNKEECIAYYGLSGLEIAMHAAGIALATLPEDDSPPRNIQEDDEKPFSAPGQPSAELVSDEERGMLLDRGLSADDSSAGEGKDDLEGDLSNSQSEEPANTEETIQKAV